jgi:hypothetical protein
VKAYHPFLLLGLSGFSWLLACRCMKELRLRTNGISCLPGDHRAWLAFLSNMLALSIEETGRKQGLYPV